MTENRDRNNLPDMKDMNFSSIGHYPYKSKYDDLGKVLSIPNLIVPQTGNPQILARFMETCFLHVMKTVYKK